MGDGTSIEWTDATWSPIRARNRATGKVGWHCEHVSEGCRSCYAESINRRLGTGLDFKPGHKRDIELFLDEKMLLNPLSWKRLRMVFVCSMTDLFADFVEDDWIDRMFAVMAMAPQHTFQILTKRPERMREYFGVADDESEGGLGARWCRAQHAITGIIPSEAPDFPLSNVWLGVSAEDQATADERIPILIDTPAAIRWVSAEPLLGPIDLSPWLGDNPVHGRFKNERGIRLPSRDERRSGDYAGRDDLASPEAGLGSLAEESGQPTMQAGEGRARLGKIPAGRPDDGRQEGLRAGVEAGLPAFQRTDPRWANREPRGWDQEAQSSGESDPRDLFGTADPRYARPEGKPRGEPEGREELPSEIDRDTGGNNQASPSFRGAPQSDRGRLRRDRSADFQDRTRTTLVGISWCVCGGESGPHARPCHLEWMEDIVRQCRDAGVAAFCKQLGANPYRDGQPVAMGNSRKGGDIADFPPELQVRQMPAEYLFQQPIGTLL